MSTTLAVIRADAMERSDMTNVGSGSDAFVQTSTWNKWINDGTRELHRKVCNFFKDTYFRATPFSFPANLIGGTPASFQLPAGLRSVKGVDVDPGTSRRRRVMRFNFDERNAFRGVNFTLPTNICPDRYYSVVGSSILQIQPQEHASGNYAVYWVPKATVFVNDSDVLDPELDQFSDYPALYAAKFALIKEESYDQAQKMQDAMDIIFADMPEALETDEGEASTVVDVYSDGNNGSGWWG